MNRRKFLLVSAAVAGTGVAGVCGAGSRFVADLTALQQELQQFLSGLPATAQLVVPAQYWPTGTARL